MNMPAIALTDHGNMHGIIDFYKACNKVKVKPIIGCEMYVAPESRFDKKKSKKNAYHLTLLAKDIKGYHNLCYLSSCGYLEGFYHKPRIDKELLQQHHKGIICLSGCFSSQLADLALSGTEDELREEIKWYHNLFGEDYYIEIQRHHMDKPSFAETWLQQQYQELLEKQTAVNEKLIKAARELSVPLVATNDTHYFDPEDWLAHEVLINIQSGEPIEIFSSERKDAFRIPNPKRRVYLTREIYFKSPQQMIDRFQDVPDAITNTLEVAEKCNVKLNFSQKHYPVFTPKEGFTQESFLRHLCEEGIPKRYTSERLEKVAEKYPGQDPMEVVRSRLEKEMELITSKGMSDYLLIVWDFINWAKQQNIPVGPGRGSGAGSIILYLIGVTEIEPLRFNLFFERFINPERLSYPDIDVDICMERREEVINYTVGKYGKENVAQIITFGTMKAKMSIKDVGRVLSVPLSKVNQIAKYVPDDLNITLEKALEVDPDLRKMYEEDGDTKRIIDLGKKMEGSIRNTGVHAAGLIVCKDPLTKYIPICLAKDSSMATTQYSMKPVEEVGMLKIDFLGLKTLTSIKLACDAIFAQTGQKIDLDTLSLEDEKTFQLLQQGRTLGVFQIELGGMRELSRQLSVDKFEEIIAIGALYRPGPMSMIPSFISRKHGREQIEYDHPLLKPILEETYGIMVYQEQVMQAAQTLANYSLGEGDVLRRAMGKKDRAQMNKESEKFRAGAIKNGLTEDLAAQIFDKIEKFASYGFNKSHSAAYGYITYVTAYLKANYPSIWMASLMTCDRDDITKIAKYIHECQSMNIAILPPDINEAGKEFIATKEGIRFAMGGIKGVGEGIVDVILEERSRAGPYKNFYDFFQRIDLKRIGKKSIEYLVDAGVFDSMGWSRDELKISIEKMYDSSLKDKKEQELGVLTFFSLKDFNKPNLFNKPPMVEKPTLKADILKREKDLLGVFLTGHPMNEYVELMTRLSCYPLSKLDTLEHNQVVRIAFIIDDVEVKMSNRAQKKFAVLQISDGIKRYEMPIWPDLYEEKSSLLEENQLIYAVVQVDKREEDIKLSCRWLDLLTRANEEMIEKCDAALDRAKLQSAYVKTKKENKTMENIIQICCNTRQMHLSQIMKIKHLLSSYPGSNKVEIIFCADNEQLGVLHLNNGSLLCDKLASDLKNILGVTQVIFK